MNRHPFARHRRRPQHGERWDALAARFEEAETPREAAQETAGGAAVLDSAPFTIDEAVCALQLADDRTRFDVVLALWGRMAKDDWYEVLGLAWPSCDFIGLHWDLLRKRLGRATRAQLDLMMTPDERRHLAELPESITVYRGCKEVNADGLSWTTDCEIASKMPFYAAYKRTRPLMLLTGIAPRDRAVLKEVRGEQEIICAVVEVRAVMQIWRDDPPVSDAEFEPIVRRVVRRLGEIRSL